MAKYYVRFKELFAQGAEMRKLKNTLDGCGEKLGSIASSIDDRDSSMRSIQSQLLRAKTKIANAGVKITDIENAIYYVSGEYESVEKRGYSAIAASK